MRYVIHWYYLSSKIFFYLMLREMNISIVLHLLIKGSLNCIHVSVHDREKSNREKKHGGRGMAVSFFTKK